jgi:hypothetical protein
VERCELTGGGHGRRAYDRSETEGGQSARDLFRDREGDGVLGMVYQTPPTPRGSNRLGRYEPGVGARAPGIDMLGQYRQRDGSRNPSKVRHCGGDRRGHTHGSGELLEVTGEAFGGCPETLRIHLEVEQEERSPEPGRISGPRPLGFAWVESRLRTRRRRRRPPGPDACAGARRSVRGRLRGSSIRHSDRSVRERSFQVGRAHEPLRPWRPERAGCVGGAIRVREGGARRITGAESHREGRFPSRGVGGVRLELEAPTRPPRISERPEPRQTPGLPTLRGQGETPGPGVGAPLSPWPAGG